MRLNLLLIKLCEQWPLNITFFEEDGFCQKQSKECKYCKKENTKNYFCYKKTYTHTKLSKMVAS